MTPERWFVRLRRARQKLLFGEPTTRKAHVLSRVGAGVVASACGGLWRRGTIRMTSWPERGVICMACVERYEATRAK